MILYSAENEEIRCNQIQYSVVSVEKKLKIKRTRLILKVFYISKINVTFNAFVY